MPEEKAAAPQAPRPILLLEINEIPWRVIDLYRKTPGFEHLDFFFSHSRTYTTLAVDTGELSPWVTWPSLHRGMSNQEHGILNLGQDPSTFNGVPIWEEYLRNGHPIGVCGSLQSWPPLDPGEGGFYIPDTFAHDEKCVPAWVEPLQRFNLGQVRKNGRVIKGESVFTSGTLPLIFSLPKMGISWRTILSIFRQVTGEKFDKAVVSRRPVFQTILFWDIFKRLFGTEKIPLFSTFFTNHVAGVMHRYWHEVFPSDFESRGTTTESNYKATMDFAMKFLDQIIADALTMQADHPELVLVFATSMGQSAIHRDSHEGFEAAVTDLRKLLSVFGLQPHQYSPLLAMVPQVVAEISDSQTRSELKGMLEECKTHSGKLVFNVHEIGRSLTITLHTPSLLDKDAGGFSTAGAAGVPGKFISWAAAGIEMTKIDPGTGYHIPEGILAFHGQGFAADDQREPIKASEVKKMLMAIGGIEDRGETRVKSAIPLAAQA